MKPSIRRIDRIIAALKAEREARFEEVLRQIALDKKRLRRGELDPAPLLELLERRINEWDMGMETLYEVRGIQERAVQRARRTGWITYKAADEICCRLGVPTACIYPYEQMSLEVSA